MRWLSKVLDRKTGKVIRYETDEPIRRMAEKAVLRSLLDLSREDPEVYYTTTGISKNTPESPNYYGKISNKNVPELLDEKYVRRGIVSKVIIRKGHKDAKQDLAVVYSVNPKKFKELERILEGL